MDCSNCNYVNNVNDSYCVKCGNKLLKTKDNKKNKIIFLVAGILLFLFLIFFSVYFLNYIKVVKKQKIIDEMSSLVYDYMFDKYNMSFEVIFISEGYKAKIHGEYPYEFTCGHEKDIKQYIFAIKSDLYSESYVTVWKNLNNNEIEINEIYGRIDFNTSYKLYKEYNDMKVSIKNDLEIFLNLNYNDYTVDYGFEYNTIRIIFNWKALDNIEKLENTLPNLLDFYNNSEIKNLYFFVEFEDFSRQYGSVSKKEDVMYFFTLSKDVDDYLKNNYNGKYKIYNEDGRKKIIVDIPVSIYKVYKRNKEKYDKLYNGLGNICVNAKDYCFIQLRFNDEFVNIDRAYREGSLENKLYIKD